MILLATILLSFPITYTGSRLGITTVVTRLDDTFATLQVRAGPYILASGDAHMTASGDLVLDESISKSLSSRGVSIAKVVPDDSCIDVTAHVRPIGYVSIRLRKVEGS